MEPPDALLIGQEAGRGGVRKGGLLFTARGGDRSQSLQHLRGGGGGGGGETGCVWSYREELPFCGN